MLFIAINTREGGIWADGHSVDPAEWDYVNQTLHDNYLNFKWLVLYTHYPPYSTNGDATEVEADIIPLAEKYDVDAVFTGHVHNYERFNVPNSETGNTTIPYFVTGGGGAPLSGRQEIPKPYSESYFSQYQYMYCEVNETTFAFECVDINEELRDEWNVTVKNRTYLNVSW